MVFSFTEDHFGHHGTLTQRGSNSPSLGLSSVLLPFVSGLVAVPLILIQIVYLTFAVHFPLLSMYYVFT